MVFRRIEFDYTGCQWGSKPLAAARKKTDSERRIEAFPARAAGSRMRAALRSGGLIWKADRVPILKKRLEKRRPMQLIHAPRLEAATLPWFNVHAPLDLPELAGKLVILDFWTYCCINCIHIIPTLKRIEAAYPDEVVVIGVHSPKFAGEKVTDNLVHAIERYEIEHPVVHDEAFRIWKKYAVRAWPTLVFIGPDGYVLGQLPGEPDPEMLMASIGEVIREMREKGVLQGEAAALLKPAAAAEKTTLRFPGKIAHDPGTGEFAVADSNHNRVLTLDAQGNVTRTIGCGAIGRTDGAFEEAAFFRPQGLCLHDGILWVADTENHCIRKVDLAKRSVSTVAGTGSQGPVLKDRGPGKQVALSSPWDVSFDNGALYFANAGTHQIGVFETDSAMAGPFAGTGAEALVDGDRIQGAFAQPSGLSIGEGKLFLADSETSAVRSVELQGKGHIATYVGTGLFDFGDRDGKGTEALLQHPLGVHYSAGRVHIADSYNHKIKTLDVNTRDVVTVEASTDLVCEDTSCTRLWEPAGVIEVAGHLFVSDTNNHRILKIGLDSRKTEIFLQ